MFNQKKKGGGVFVQRTRHTPLSLAITPRTQSETGRVWGGGNFNTLSFGPEILKHYHEDTSSGEISWKLRNSISILLGSFTVRVYSQNPWVLRKGTNLSYHDYSLIIETINKLEWVALSFSELQWVLRAQTWLEFQLQCSLAGWTDALPISSSVKWGQQRPLPFTVIVRFKTREYERMHKPSSMQSSNYSEFDHWGSCSSAFTTEGRWDERGGCVLLLPAPASTQLLSSAGKCPGPGTIWRWMLSSPGWFYLSRGLAGTVYPQALILRAQLCSLCLGRQSSLLALLLHQGVTRLTSYTGDNRYRTQSLIPL